MENATLIHSQTLTFNHKDYDVQIYLRPNGSILALTEIAPKDVIIHDGRCLEEVMKKHLRLLPLALDTRLINAGRPPMSQDQEPHRCHS
ncbi:MAG: hypothetical protein SV239_03235 [Thermodesulfobacteriota bacterium]|jgi:hypothetical protein|nr:hypothetical protein [Thermodesulfobacteriota bacterium]